MRVAVVALNSLVAVFFFGFLSYTFVASQHLEGVARQFVTEKTLHYSAPLVALAEETLNSKLVRKMLTADRMAMLENEIAAYRSDPAQYVRDLTRQAKLAAKVDKANPQLAKVAGIKERIRTYYDGTLNALIVDLRIFGTSNLIAAILALSLAWWSSAKIRQPIVWFSFLMFVSVLCTSSMYVDNLTFFRILFHSHMGWGYVFALGAMLIWLCREYGEFWQTIENLMPSDAEALDAQDRDGTDQRQPVVSAKQRVALGS